MERTLHNRVFKRTTATHNHKQNVRFTQKSGNLKSRFNLKCQISLRSRLLVPTIVQDSISLRRKPVSAPSCSKPKLCACGAVASTLADRSQTCTWHAGFASDRPETVHMAAGAIAPGRLARRRSKPSFTAGATAEAADPSAPLPGFIGESKAREALCAAAGVAGLLAWQRGCGVAAQALGIPVPATVTALVMLQALLLVPRLRPTLHRLLGPCSRLLDTWIGLIFVPFITGLFITAVPSGLTLLALCTTLTLSWLVTVVLAAGVMTALSSASPTAPAALAPLDCSEGLDCSVEWIDEDTRMQQRQKQGQILAGSLYSLLSTRVAMVATLLVSLLLLLPGEWGQWGASIGALLGVTFVAYRLAQKLPASWQRRGLFPTVTAGAVLGCCLWLVGGRAAVLQYQTTIGEALLGLVAPAVVATALKIDSQREVLKANWAGLVAVIAATVPASLCYTAGLGRVLGLPAALSLAALPKSTTTGLAIAMAASLGVSVPLAAAGVVWCGTIGLSLGPAVMDALGIALPSARGAAMGITSHSVGALVLDINGEKEASAIAGAVFAIAGVFSVLLCSFQPFQSLLFRIAGL